MEDERVIIWTVKNKEGEREIEFNGKLNVSN